MPNIMQMLRSTVARRRPTGKKPGEVWINFADHTMGFVDMTGAAIDPIAIPHYSPSTTYAVGDLVRQGSDIQECITAVVAPEAFAPAKWRAITHTRQALDARYLAIADQAIPPFDATKAYAAGDVVLEGGNIYRAPGAIAAGAFNATQWRRFVRAEGDTMTGNLDLSATAVARVMLPAGSATAPALKVGTREDGLIEDANGLGIVNNGALTHRFMPDAIHATIPNCRYLVTDAAIGISVNGIRPIDGHAVSSYGIINDLGNTRAVGTRAYDDGTLSFVIDVNPNNAGAGGFHQFNFRGNGTGYAPGGWQPGSDARVKTNVQPITGSLAKIASIKGYTYDRADLGTTGHAGVLAQEVQAVLPQAVTVAPFPMPDQFAQGDSSGFRAVDPMALIGLLIGAVNELSAKVAALEARAP